MALVVLPKTLTAKTEAKAADVMADLTAITAQVNGKLDTANLAESLRNALTPTGSVFAIARSSAPAGFVLCQGQAISRTTFAVLFAAIGTTFGNGDGTTTFNVPDLRGRVPVGVDAGAGRLDNSWALALLGQAAGSMWMQQHAHANGGGTSVESAVHAHNLGWFQNNRHEGSGFQYATVDVGGNTPTSTETAFHTHALTGGTQLEGVGNGQNMPPYQVLNWMIKT